MFYTFHNYDVKAWLTVEIDGVISSAFDAPDVVLKETLKKKWSVLKFPKSLLILVLTIFFFTGTGHPSCIDDTAHCLFNELHNSPYRLVQSR